MWNFCVFQLTVEERGLSVHLSIITTSGPAAVLSHHLLSWASRQAERLFLDVLPALSFLRSAVVL